MPPLNLPFHLHNGGPRPVPQMIVDIREVVDGAVLSGPLAPDAPDVLVQRL